MSRKEKKGGKRYYLLVLSQGVEKDLEREKVVSKRQKAGGPRLGGFWFQSHAPIGFFQKNKKEENALLSSGSSCPRV